MKLVSHSNSEYNFCFLIRLQYFPLITVDEEYNITSLQLGLIYLIKLGDLSMSSFEIFFLFLFVIVLVKKLYQSLLNII